MIPERDSKIKDAAEYCKLAAGLFFADDRSGAYAKLATVANLLRIAAHEHPDQQDLIPTAYRQAQALRDNAHDTAWPAPDLANQAITIAAQLRTSEPSEAAGRDE